MNRIGNYVQRIGLPAVLVFIAGLQNIPEDLYEAARLDGATPWQQFRHVTLPMLKPILTIVIQTPRDAERLRANPLGIYVNAINWSREMGQ